MKRFVSAKIIFPAMALAAGHAAHAAEDVINPDRPGVVESSQVVGSGIMQIETSISEEHNSEADIDERTYTTPTLIRAGINDTWELRMESGGRTVQHTRINGTTRTLSGYADISIGMKWRFTDENTASHRPSTAWLFDVTTDTGSREFRGNGLRPSVRFVAEWTLPDDASLGVMPGVVYDRNDQHHFVSSMLAANYSKQFTPLLRGFVELAAQQLASTADGGNIIVADTGMTWLLNKDMQLDASIQRGLSDAAPDWLAAVGFSMRF